ncbi:calpain-D-like [Centruroides sculpturatus]|uniref:calpain-D-like n=1 Tax=Centruroides sculpturatus TaxID=218467 RepID=UPI000C6D9168|nr:calpain-D-like [Centruroides sculpturatus]
MNRKRKFIDNSFPPDSKSLYYDPKINKVECQWLRPCKIKSSHAESEIDWVMIRYPLEASDIVQGSLGDCWLMSALAVLVKQPQLLERVIVTKDICPEGAYKFQLYKNGYWKLVVIDDLLPCDANGFLLYSEAKRKQLWVSLIEKAAAKLHGCYEALESGRVIDGLQVLTGAPCENLILNCKLLCLRNPWANYVWKGNWSTHSRLWTSKLRKKLMPPDIEESSFWISFEDILKYFDSIDVCKIRSNWHEARFEGTYPCFADHKNLTAVKIYISELTELELMLFQNDQRNVENSERSYLDLCITVFHTASGHVGLFKECSSRQIRCFVGCNTMLEMGEYVVICFAFNHWNINLKSKDYPKSLLVIQSSKCLQMKKALSHKHIFADSIINLVIAKGARHEGREGMTAYYLTKHWAGLVVVIENRLPNLAIQVICDCSESTNIVSTRKTLFTADRVPPLHRQVVMLLTQVRAGENYTIIHRLTHYLFGNKVVQKILPPGIKHNPRINSELSGLHEPIPFENSTANFHLISSISSWKIQC